MAATHKERYEAPATQVVDLHFQGIVCQSGGDPLYTIPGYGPVTELN